MASADKTLAAEVRRGTRFSVSFGRAVAKTGDDMKKFNSHRLILGLFILAFIVITELVTARYKLPAWPAYVAWILFFIEHFNARRAPHILLGAVVGIVFILLAPSAIGLLAKVVGVEWGRLIYILAAVYAIVAFGEIVPLLLNNYTFLFFTVCGLALGAPNPNPYVWAVMAVIGGGLLIGGSWVASQWLDGRLGLAVVPAHEAR